MQYALRCKALTLFVLRALLVIALCSGSLQLRSQQDSQQSPFGIAWRVIGAWHVQGDNRSISNGDAIAPGALLQPTGEQHDHSITVLLPDGQRILYECFTSRDCARGFRVPSLYREPLAIAVDLLRRVNAISRQNGAPDKAHERADSGPSRDEAVALIRSDGKVEVAGLAAALSNGSYSYIARSVAHSSQAPLRGGFEKHGSSITLDIPTTGLYDVLISDHLDTPRIDLLLAAVKQSHGGSTQKEFKDVDVLLKDWNEDYQGWPIHDFRRYFLRSVMSGVEPAPRKKLPPSSKGIGSEAAGVACEPRFTPAPGVFRTDTDVALECAETGATIHYTVDGSQPLDGAAVYRAPIVVKGTALTIKAFASAEGKKDSPVVTGIFRIGD
jgi:hypothetical protein